MTLSPEDLAELRNAKELLENPSLSVQDHGDHRPPPLLSTGSTIVGPILSSACRSVIGCP